MCEIYDVPSSSRSKAGYKSVDIFGAALPPHRELPLVSAAAHFQFHFITFYVGLISTSIKSSSDCNMASAVHSRRALTIVEEWWAVAMITLAVLMCRELAQMTGLIELRVWWKHRCQITAMGRALFLREPPSNSQKLVRSGLRFVGGGRGGGGWRAVFHPLEMENACINCSIHERLQEFCSKLVPVQYSRILRCSRSLLALR